MIAVSASRPLMRAVVCGWHRLHGLHGGEAAIGEDVDVGAVDGCFAVDCEFAQVLVDNLCDRAPRVAINNFGVEIQKVEGGAVE